MKKMYQTLFTLALLVFGVMGANAGERIQLTADMVYSYDGFGADAQKIGPLETATCVFEQAEGCPFGDTSCNAWADLGNFAKLYVKMEGCDDSGTPNGSNPRIFINRLETEGQFNADRSQAKCLVIPNAGTWAEDFYTVDEDGVYVINLIKIKKEFGFVHLHSIKGSAWNTKAILYLLEAEKADPAQQVGWTSMINNSDMEGDDNSSFFTKINTGDNADKVVNSELVDGVGVNGSRGIMVTAGAKTANAWDNQFWFRFNEDLPAGTKYRVSFDYKADAVANVSTQAHAEPSDYIHHEMFGTMSFDTDWKKFETEGEVSEQQSTADKKFRSVAFNLNELADANNYYFDNIVFEIYKFGTTAAFSNDVILFDFGFETNIPELVKAGGKPRLMFPLDCASVTVNGKDVELYSIEGFADGRFYVFLQEGVGENDEVIVNFFNPKDPAYRLVYASGENAGAAMTDFTNIVAQYDYSIEENEGYPYTYVTPTLLKADPEDGSFNLPNSIKEFKLTFDKPVDISKVVATINGEAMAISPADGFAQELTLIRPGEGDMATGEYTITVTKIFPEEFISDEIFGEYTYTVSVGKVEYDPTDVAKDIIPIDYFANCAANTVPEGFVLYADGDPAEERVPGGNYGSGNRMMDFSAGGDFTKGLYMRTWYLEYGTLEDHYLDFEAGKKYKISFNTCQWKSDGGKYLTFVILDAEGNEVMREVVTNEPCVNEKRDAVSGTTSFDKNFIAEAAGRYTMRWIVAKNAEGDATDNAWSNGVILANVKVMYTPNQIGFEETQLLNTALENAKKAAEENGAERYDGEALDALNAAIAKYEAEKEGYTAPSQYKDGAAALDAAAQAQKDHRLLCDNYDKVIKQAIDVIRQNESHQFADGTWGATKFVATDLFNELKAIVANYRGTSQWIDVANYEENPEAEPNMQLFYSYDSLKVDNALKEAIDELEGIANTCSLLFTEGASNCSSTGVMVAIERLRLGAEDLKALGVPADDELVVAANNALTDDDVLADKIKARIREIVYGQLKDPANELFKAVIDDVTLEETTPTYDMTVFVKNPNIYKQSANLDYSEEAVPGWVIPEGFARPGLSCGWGATKGTEVIAEDCMFQTWGASYRVEQTITDLPAGVYTLQIGFGERMNEDASSNMENSFVYAKYSDTLAPEEGMEEDRELNFAGTAECPGIGQSFPNHNAIISGLVVTDGILTIGANASQGSHTFLNDVRLLLTGAASVDYAALYTENAEVIETGIESAAAPKVRAIELYDLNGRRITSARQGIVLMKKYMSNGTVETVKVVRK